jgi:predicted RNA binding protein YcfA (HicA-like mRNA interferase family)
VSKFPRLSGKEVIKILVNEFAFETVRQTGSHAVLRKFANNKKIVTIVPLHKELKIGTLLGVLNLAKIEKTNFSNAFRSCSYVVS